jgi:hypothetical protein
MENTELLDALMDEHEALKEIALMLEVLEDEGLNDPEEKVLLKSFKKVEEVIHIRAKKWTGNTSE